MKKCLILVVWFVVFTALLTYSLSLITAPDTVSNIFGILILSITVALSVKTKCLTTIKLKRNDRRKSKGS